MDQSLVVVDKPAGMPSVSPRSEGKASAWSALRRVFQERAATGSNAARSGGRRGEPRGRPAGPAGARTPSGPGPRPRRESGVELYLVHRLDQPASGLLVFAKTERARKGLKDLLAAREMGRRYAAIVEGRPTEAQGEIRSRLVELEGPTHPMRSLRAGDGTERRAKAKAAVTRWRLLGARAGRSALEVELETGRKHQIRVHLAEAGMPVVGDRLYGQRGSFKPAKEAPGREGAGARPPARRLLLHAWKLAFQHPVTRRKLEFVSPPGREFEEAVPGAFRTS